MIVIDKIIIKGECRSKKNSKRIVRRGKFPIIISSEAYLKWEASAKHELKGVSPLFNSHWPVLAHFKFFMTTKRKFDYNNMSQGPCDVLQSEGIIPEDNYAYIIPVFHGDFSGIEIDKNDPRVEIIFTTF